MIARRAPVQAADDRPVSDADALLDALVAALRRWVGERRRAEERLASFAFDERPPGVVPSPTTAPEPGQRADPGGGAAAEVPVAWRYYLLQTLRVAGDPAVIALLERLRDSPRRLDDLAESARLARGAGAATAGDRIATADWIGGLAAAGLVSRELEADRVALAPLGSAVLDLLAELEHRLETTAARAATAGATR